MAEREATSEAAPRLEAEIRGRATKQLPAARNHDTATQNKARAREEPSPGPPASETDARPLGHQPRGGAPARPRLNCGRKAPAGKACKFSAAIFCDFSPDLGFEWQGRFSSLREARRAENEAPGRAHTLSTNSYIYT